MNKVFFALVIFAAPALGDIALPRWGQAIGRSGHTDGQIYKAQRYETKGPVGFEVEIRPLVCKPVVTRNPKCPFEYADVTFGSPTVEIKKSGFNGVHCKIENFIHLVTVDESVRLWDTPAHFLQNHIWNRTGFILVKGEKFRTRDSKVVDPACLTYDELLASEVPEASSGL